MKATSTVQDFKKFVNRGNIIDLATGIIIGSAFTAIVNSLVNDVIMPLLSLAINFDLTKAKWILRPELTAIVDGEEVVTQTQISLNYGAFLQYFINFIVIALAIFTAVKIVKLIKNSYIRSEIKYIKKLKEKHPEYFDEEDELGTRLYEKLKKQHPEHFKNEIALEIEEAKAKAESNISPQELNNQLLLRLNENLERAFPIKEETNQAK